MDWFKFLVITLMAIVTYGVYFYKSYSNEKGKNLATKEDIEEITQKVETIKTSLLAQTQYKMSYEEETRRNLLNVYHCYIAWFNRVQSVQFTSFDYEVGTEENLTTKIYEAHFEFLSAGSKVELYIQDENLSQLLFKLLEKSNSINNRVASKLAEVYPYVTKKKLLGYDRYLNDSFGFLREFIKDGGSVKMYVDKYISFINELGKETNDKLQVHNKAINAEIIEISKLSKQLKRYCFDYMRKNLA